MPTFTMTLKDAIEIEDGNIGLDDYPIFDESYRKTLNQKIIDHYWNQEIGQETISMFRHAMKRRMNEIMPLYNQHYTLSKLEIDPLSTVSIKAITGTVAETRGTAESETESEGNSSNTSLSDAKSRAVASDTPQNALSENGDYASSMQDSISDSRASGEASDTNKATANETRGEESKQDSDSTTQGYSGHAPVLIYAARQALVNVDLMVINELQELFMLIWSNNDSYTRRRIGYGYYGY